MEMKPADIRPVARRSITQAAPMELVNSEVSEMRKIIQQTGLSVNDKLFWVPEILQ